MNTSGSFATARKPVLSADIGYLSATLHRTKSYAATSRMTGVSEATLRQVLPRPEARITIVPNVPEPSPTSLTIKQLLMLMCAEEEVSYEDMMGQSRKQNLARPRQRCMWAMKKMKPNLSYPEVGRRFGGRDHTTVLHAVRQIEERYRTDEEERAKVNRLINVIREAEGFDKTIESIDYEIADLESRIMILKAKREEMTYAA